MKKKIFLSLLIALLTVSVLSGCGSEDKSGNNSAGEEKQRAKAADFTVKDQYGKTHTLSKYKGKVVLISFWATWCSACRTELPYIEDIYKKYEDKKDVVILSCTSPTHSNEVEPEEMDAYELVVTTLGVEGMPLLRFKTGDLSPPSPGCAGWGWPTWPGRRRRCAGP